MTAVKAHEVERALRSHRPEQHPCLLVFGPDAGRVAELARNAAAAGVDDPADAFQLVRLDGDSVLDQPGRLAEEVSTFGLFGRRRAIWVRPTSRNIAPAVSAALDVIGSGTLLVIEAGDLGKSSPLRTLCETSSRALALPCYADESRDLASIVRETLATASLTIDDEARELLIESLGGDRLASRGELAKLALYCHGRTRVTRDDVAAVVSDVSSLRIDAALDAAFGGDLAETESCLRQLAREGVAPGLVLNLALRHALLLLTSRGAVESGQEREAALRSWGRMTMQRRERIGAQLASWTSGRLRAVVRSLQDATLESRRAAALASALTDSALLRVASGGRPTQAARSRRASASS